MSRFVFSLGIVPVQEWIAAARRSRDLRAGSTLLSWLMAKLLVEVSVSFDVRSELVLPRPPEGRGAAWFRAFASQSFGEALQETYGIPNRASGFVEGSEERVGEVFDGLAERLLAVWKSFQDEFLTKDRVKDELWTELVDHVAAYHLLTGGRADCPFGLVWALLPVAEDKDRGASLKRIDEIFADLKRTRPISPWRWGSPAGKCNQCGQREAMGPRHDFRAWRRWQDELAKLGTVRDGTLLEAGERLCYVCFTRRVAGYADREGGAGAGFPATGEVAVRRWRERVEQVPDAEKWLKAIERTSLGKLDFGRALLVPLPVLTAEVREKRASAADAADLIEAREGLRKVLEDLRRQQDPMAGDRPIPLDPPRYVGLLAFDGDGLGELVQERPNEVPALIPQFAARAHQALSDQAVFYLGGDEGLALLPAAEALALAREVRTAYETTVDAGLDDRAATLSAGLAFFAYDSPLDAAIAAAHEALERAKDLDGKDALGVTVTTSSGTRLGHVDHWEGWRRVEKAVELISQGHLSPSWAHDAAAFLRSLPPADLHPERRSEAARAEIERLFHRRLSEKIKDRGGAWERVEGPSWLRADAPSRSPEAFHLIAFLARREAAGADSDPAQEAA